VTSTALELLQEGGIVTRDGKLQPAVVRRIATSVQKRLGPDSVVSVAYATKGILVYSNPLSYNMFTDQVNLRMYLSPNDVGSGKFVELADQTALQLATMWKHMAEGEIVISEEVHVLVADVHHANGSCIRVDLQAHTIHCPIDEAMKRC
jgi:hypothetical protein